MTKEALKLALDALEMTLDTPTDVYDTKYQKAIDVAKEALSSPNGDAQPEQEPVTVLPDGSAFAVMSYPLPKDHWLYAERQYDGDADEPNELGKPILTHALRDAVVSAVRYAIRGATNCGKELDFDPDALVQNAVYALCGPYGLAESKKPEQEPVAQWLEDAFREGWAACRDAEFVGEDEEDWKFGNSTANSRMIDLQQSTPPQRTAAVGEDTRRAWVGLTDEEIWESDGYKVAITDQETRWLYRFAKEIEAKLKAKNERKEKNTDA